MWAAGRELEAEARKDAEDKHKGIRHIINKAALKRKEMRRKAARDAK